MEEEWNLVNSLNSSLNVPENIEKSTSVELNFNRFANQPEFHIDDDGYPEDYDQQLMDEGVIFCDSPPPPDDEEEEIYEDGEYSQEYEEELYEDEEYEEGIYEDQELPQEEEEEIYEEEIYEEGLPQEELYEEGLSQEEVYEEDLSLEEDLIQDEEELLQEEELTLEEGDLTLEDEDLIQNEEEFLQEEQQYIIDEDEDINFTLGDSKLINNDPITDDVRNNNELQEQRINQFKNIYLSSFFPINNFMNEQENNNTRESQVDKSAIWKNTETGSSVPYISPDVSKEEDIDEEIPKFTGSKVYKNLFNLLYYILNEHV